MKNNYQRKVKKELIPTCNIMGVNIAAINMEWLLNYLDKNLSEIKGDYICVSNVHTTVTSYENPYYCAIQNDGLMAIPDGGPLSSVGRKRGCEKMERTTGPSLMGEIFNISAEKGYRHYFYGSTEETLELLYKKLNENYPGIQIAGMYSPPFRSMTEEEDQAIVERINEVNPDFVWIGLGAPKQEKWMAEHQGKINAPQKKFGMIKLGFPLGETYDNGRYSFVWANAGVIVFQGTAGIRNGEEYMKVVHIESGLGNQMLSYSELLLLKKLNNDDCYIETIIYEIPECNKIISQWYGYELSRIFNINTPDIHSLFSSEEWKNVISDVRKTEFWKNWNYPTVIVNVLNKYGLNLVNYRGNVDLTVHNSWKSKITNNRVGYFIKRVLRPLYQDSYIKKMSNKKEMFLKTSDNAYTGQWLGLMKVDSGIEFIEDDIRKIFQFPKLEGKRNLELEKLIKTTNSVAIHARRGDALGTNGYCYKYGYFKRAIKYIKKKVENPIFIFFTDPGSIQWCKENEKIFGLDFREDRVMFVDWNGGEDSYRDMQLMSYCKHNVITFSSFGWWGSWLNENPEKITISPSVWINTTNHF